MVLNKTDDYAYGGFNNIRTVYGLKTGLGYTVQSNNFNCFINSALPTLYKVYNVTTEFYALTQSKERLYDQNDPNKYIETITDYTYSPSSYQLAQVRTSMLATKVGNNNLLLIAAAGFAVTAIVVRMLAREKEKLLAIAPEAQRTSLSHRLSGSAFDGFKLLLRSRYLLLIALFLLLMTWISTIVYFQLGDLITKAFQNREERTHVYAMIDLAVNSCAVLIQLLGTGRFIARFGVGAGLLLNPIIMVAAFLAMAFSPVLMLLGAIQIVRRVAEYAVAKPTREMLFTLVDQESRYKAKNVIDTVVYRFGDFTAAWISAAVLPYGVIGLALFGAVVSLIWFPVAYLLGREYEAARSSGEPPSTAH